MCAKVRNFVLFLNRIMCKFAGKLLNVDMKGFFRNLYCVVAVSLVITSCGSAKKVVYFQDTTQGTEVLDATGSAITLKPDDKISILVHSKDMALASIFNLPVASRTIGYSNNQNGLSSGGYGVTGYTVDPSGCIDFPVIGKMYVAGFTRDGLEKHIKNELITRSLIKDPIVTVEFLNLRVSVLGDVAAPGRYPIDHDEFTILDAISAAGDLTITGERTTVKVMRTENGIKRTYMVDLTSAADVVKSPVYFLRQNDVVYVSPNIVKARNSTVQGNSLLTPGFWTGTLSLVITISTLVINLLNLKK